MLGKVIKYDFKAVARFLLPFYGVLLLSSALTNISGAIRNTEALKGNMFFNLASGLSVTLYVLSTILALVGTEIILIIHYYKRFTGDEAYFTFTLPASHDTQLLGKLLNGAIWTFISVAVVVASVFILLAGKVSGDQIRAIWMQAKPILAQFVGAFGSKFEFGGIVALWVIMVLFANQMELYFCITAGQIIKGHRILGAFVSYMVLKFVQQIIQAVLSLTQYTSFRDAVLADSMSMTWVSPYMWLTMIELIVFLVIEYVVTSLLLKKSLNVE